MAFLRERRAGWPARKHLEHQGDPDLERGGSEAPTDFPAGAVAGRARSRGPHRRHRRAFPDAQPGPGARATPRPSPPALSVPTPASRRPRRSLRSIADLPRNACDRCARPNVGSDATRTTRSRSVDIMDWRTLVKARAGTTDIVRWPPGTSGETSSWQRIRQSCVAPTTLCQTATAGAARIMAVDTAETPPASADADADSPEAGPPAPEEPSFRSVPHGCGVLGDPSRTLHRLGVAPPENRTRLQPF